MTNKHTPGPWAVIDDGIWNVSVRSDGTVCHINNKGDWFPKGETQIGRCQNQMLADARLIASAPELLAALQDLLAMCQRQEDFNDDGDGGMFERAQAAILKATGEPV